MTFDDRDDTSGAVDMAVVKSGEPSNKYAITRDDIPALIVRAAAAIECM